MSPRLRLHAACERHGTRVVVRACLDLLAGGDADPALLVALGGPHAQDLLARGLPAVHRYWVRTWGARGLLYAWDTTLVPQVAPVLVDACADEAWRVREMVCKVVAHHRVDDAFDAVAALREDPVERVRAAAGRAVVRVAGG